MRRIGKYNRSGGLTCGTNEVLTLGCNRVPVPLKELNDDLCQEKRKDGQGMRRGGADLCQRLAWERAPPMRER